MQHLKQQPKRLAALHKLNGPQPTIFCFNRSSKQSNMHTPQELQDFFAQVRALSWLGQQMNQTFGRSASDVSE